MPTAGLETRKGWGAIAVIAVLMLALTAGGWVIGRAGGARSSDAPQAVDLGRRARITIAPGWEIVDQASAPTPYVIVTNGTGSLAVNELRGDPLQLIRGFVAEVLEPAGEQLTVSDPTSVELPSGRVVLRVGYVLVRPDVAFPLEGEVTAFQSGRTVVLFDATAPEGAFVTVQPDVEAMIESTEIR